MGEGVKDGESASKSQTDFEMLGDKISVLIIISMRSLLWSHRVISVTYLISILSASPSGMARSLRVPSVTERPRRLDTS